MEERSVDTVDEISEIKQTWKKVESVSKKVGLREGITAGREKNFQEYFDIGFKEGFKNGYALGKYKGTLVAHSKQSSSGLVKYPILEKIGRGGCEVCRNEDLLTKDVPEIIRNQTELSNRNLHALYYTCNSIVKCDTLPNTLS